MVAREAPQNAPDYSATCAERHLKVASTENGTVSWSCDAKFAICNAADPLASAIERGCQTPLGTPTDCARCGDRCPYGYCAEAVCQAEAQGILGRTASISLPPHAARGVVVTLTPGARVRALGAAVDARFARGKIRLAIYRDEDQGIVPSLYVASTDLLDATLDSGSLASLEGEHILRVEGRIDHEFVPDAQTAYYVFVVASDQNVLWADDVSEDFVCALSVSSEALSFPSRNPFPEDCLTQSRPGLYAIVTPN
jgi:hypothetical protein